jgi:hypothetical protein
VVDDKYKRRPKLGKGRLRVERVDLAVAGRLHGGQAFAPAARSSSAQERRSFHDAAATIVDALGRDLALTIFADVARNANGGSPACSAFDRPRRFKGSRPTSCPRAGR